MKYNSLNAFLHLCYMPEASTELLDPLISNQHEFRKQKRLYKDKPKEVLINEGCLILKKIFKELRPSNNAKQIIPLSGGLDSRAILAGLCEEGLRENITAVTYGIPGTYDYEIGKMVAKYSGVRNVLIDLNKETVTKNVLQYTCQADGAWTPITSSYYNRLISIMFGNDVTYWSGFLGGAIVGNHYKKNYEFINWKEACSDYLRINRWEKNSNISLTNKDLDMLFLLPAYPPIEDSLLVSFPEQLNFCIFQIKWLKKSIVKIAKNVKTPFTHPEWVFFMLAIPNEYRLDCDLYRGILANLYPAYYKLPTKDLRGKPLIVNGYRSNIINVFNESMYYKNVNKNLNYIDYDLAYRKREDFRLLVNNSISYLESKKIIPWINLKDIWNKHYSGEFDIWRTLECLVSLAISLEVAGNEYN